jgi:ketosteroid isomerase-like protein
MSQENVEIVRRMHEPYEGKDVMPMIREAVASFGPDPDPAVVLAWWAEDPGWRHVHAEAEWDTSAVAGVGVKVKGPAEVARWWADWTETWESYIYKTAEYRDMGDSVLTKTDIQTRPPGAEHDLAMTLFQLWEVRDEKVAVCRAFLSESEALEAAGLSE